jgi:hypothetical protein
MTAAFLVHAPGVTGHYSSNESHSNTGTIYDSGTMTLALNTQLDYIYITLVHVVMYYTGSALVAAAANVRHQEVTYGTVTVVHGQYGYPI